MIASNVVETFEQALLREYGLTAEQCYRYCDVTGIEQNVSIVTSTKLYGLTQNRALQALQFGLGMRHPGYHIFVMGAVGSGRLALCRSLVTARAGDESTARDLCYAHHFTDPWRPQALQLAPGLGRCLATDILSVVRAWRGQLPAPEALAQQLAPLLQRYADEPQALSYLQAMQQDVQLQQAQQLLHANTAHGDWELRYGINVVVDHGGTQGAPVLYLDELAYHKLFGAIDVDGSDVRATGLHHALSAGALLQANGGYLMVDATAIGNHYELWGALKRCLRQGEVHIEPHLQGDGQTRQPGYRCQPQAVPLSLKLIFIGEPGLYYHLCEYDEDFAALIKVVAEFDNAAARSRESELVYAAWMRAQAQDLRPLEVQAQALIVEYAARLVEDQDRLSTRFDKLDDLLREADYWSKDMGAESIDVPVLQQTFASRRQRHQRSQQHLLEEMQRGQVMIQTAGRIVGQVNGLSVVELGNYEYGHPSCISARVRAGKGEVLDIEREIDMGGPIHSKGVLILSGYLNGCYAIDHPLSFSASLVFEQTYGGVEGDSASSAELYALLSALANIPLKQGLAVTGAVNQSGNLQTVGGINEKIEGYFDLCLARGLDGSHGVVIPRANVSHLMLRTDVIEALQKRQFTIYAVDTIDQGMEILTGLPAGERDEMGHYPEGSINALVELRLIVMANQAHASDDSEHSEHGEHDE